MNDASSIDLHALSLLRAVALHHGITPAAKSVGLSQSALTRQIQSAEAELGFPVFDRTTRSISLTKAGAQLLVETETLHQSLRGTLRKIQEDCFGAVRSISLGVSSGVSAAHLPGFLHSQVRKHPEVRLMVAHLPDAELIESVKQGRLDAGVLCLPPRLPLSVAVSHRIADVFVLISPAANEPPAFLKSPTQWPDWVGKQTWLFPTAGTGSRSCLNEWWEKQGLRPIPAMELDSFDLMVSLVALGLGVACVPRRALSAFPRKKQLLVMSPPVVLTRELAVITPKQVRPPIHVAQFLKNILFS